MIYVQIYWIIIEERKACLHILHVDLYILQKWFLKWLLLTGFLGLGLLLFLLHYSFIFSSRKSFFVLLKMLWKKKSLLFLVAVFKTE